MKSLLAVGAAACLTVACSSMGGGASGPRAIATVDPTQGNGARGTVTFTQRGDDVRVTAELSGLALDARNGIHVHEKGDCSAPDAESAGGHFNPLGVPHGLPPDGTRHLGDLGNIEVEPNGTGRTEVVVQGASLVEGAPSSFLGRAIIVHAKKDDGGQPTGNAGARIGCGVISATPR